MEKNKSHQSYNELIQKNNNSAVLILENGNIFYGHGYGAQGLKVGEVCFNTSMSGYQEIITDPSYNGQIINFTFPHIGNVGTNSDDNEANKSFASGIISREPPPEGSNWRSELNFNVWLKKQNIIGISGLDTRQLTKIIKEKKAPLGLISHNVEGQFDLNLLYKKLFNHPRLKGSNLVPKVSSNKVTEWKNGLWGKVKIKNKKTELHVVAYDFGIKHNILRCLKNLNIKVTLVPFDFDYIKLKKLNPDGIFLSNGPGDPMATYESIKRNFDNILTLNIPIFGICIGHQLLAIALGAKTRKMKQGHRGGNHPVINLLNKKVEITSQNHGFNVMDENLPSELKVTHKSLFDQSIEGLEHSTKPIFSVQYHPEASPGPHDSRYLFKKFYNFLLDKE